MSRSLSVFALSACVLGIALMTATSKAAPEPARVLRHVVLFKFKPEASKQQIQEIVEAFAELPKKIDTIKAYEAGTDNSPEMLSKGFTHCFLVTFADEKGRETYLPHPAHQAFVAKLRPIMEDALVVDYWTK